MDYLLDPYHEALEVKNNCHPIELIQSAIEKCLILPYKKIQSPIITTLLTCQSKYSSILPLIICYGPSGSGKSNIGKLAHGLWKLDDRWLLAGKTTPTSIRNLIMEQKYGENWQLEDWQLLDEENSLLIWDDINPLILQDALLQSILKSGYSRKSANIGIAMQGGQNLYFNCFSQKITSTIHPIWTINDLVELKRRSLILPHEYVDSLDANDKQDNRDLDHLIDLDYISFKGYSGTTQLRLAEDEWFNLQQLRKKLRGKLRYAGFPLDFGKLIFDLICSSVITGVFHDLNDSIQAFEKFYGVQKEVLSEKSEFQLWLDRYLAEEIQLQSQSLAVKEAGFPIVIKRSKLQQAIDNATAEKEIPNAKYDLLGIMKINGWKLNGSSRNVFERHI
jgi:hypothetical protein